MSLATILHRPKQRIVGWSRLFPFFLICFLSRSWNTLFNVPDCKHYHSIRFSKGFPLLPLQSLVDRPDVIFFFDIVNKNIIHKVAHKIRNTGTAQRKKLLHTLIFITYSYSAAQTSSGTRCAMIKWKEYVIRVGWNKEKASLWYHSFSEVDKKE